MSSPHNPTDGPVLLAELLREAGVAEELANHTLRTTFFGSVTAREAVASWDHVEASIQALERDLAKVTASIEATSSSPALASVHKAAKQTFGELGDELATKEREKNDIARAFADVWRMWKHQYERDALQKLCDDQNERSAAAKARTPGPNRTPAPRGGLASDGKKSWAGRQLDPACARCAARSQTCHAHENRSGQVKLACFECNVARVACSLSQKPTDHRQAPDRDASEQPSGGGRRCFGPRSVQEAALAARADPNSNAAVRAAVERLTATLEKTNGHLDRCLCALVKAGDSASAVRAGQKRKRSAMDA